MAFSQEVKDRAYILAGGKCKHCNKACRRVEGESGYNYPDSEFHHRLSQIAGGSDSLGNCVHLCINCHKNTNSYGNH